MWSQIQLFPDQASTMAPRVDGIYFALLAFSGFFIVLIAGLIIFFAIRYRRRSDEEVPPEVKESTMVELGWAIPPFLIVLVVYFWGAQVFFDAIQPPNNTHEVYVVAKQWMWHLQHPEGQREINELHVPLNKPVKLTLISQDVIHNFSIPDFRVKQDVIPGRYTTLWFTPTKKGRFRLFCAEYCGTNHSQMVGWIEVMEPSRFETWLTEDADSSPATQGRKLFLQQQCITCHNREGNAPLLEEIWHKKIPLRNGNTVYVDEAYLRESILNPDAKVVAGFDQEMPSYDGQLSETELMQLIIFIRSLGPGDTPQRVEQTEPPAVLPDENKKDASP